MPRKPRIVITGQPLHVLQRGNNRQAIFFAEKDYRVFLEAVRAACAKYGCAVHAYVLMTNHVHLLVTPEHENSLSSMMQSVGRRYVRYVNDRYRRSGTLWEGRFKCSLIDTPNYLFACFVYIEMNPVRARMVAGPQHYPWSSFQANALGRNDPVLTPHEQYHKLGGTAEKRRQAYKALFSKYFSDGTLASIRDSIENDLPLGSSQFKEDIERKIQRPVSRQSHGGDRRSRSFQVHAQV
jgi:putative transposase